MLAIIEKKWDVKYIQILHAPTKGATELIGEGLQFTQYKTFCTLKIDVFKIPDNKNIGILFTKYELRFLDQANSSSAGV